jgi:hypothetical protein
MTIADPAITVPHRRALGVEYLVKALSTGEQSAANRLAPFLAADLVYDTNSQPGVFPLGREVFSGKAAVLARLSGQRPVTFGFARLGWSEPFAEGDDLRVVTSGAVTLDIGFNAGDEITRVYLDGGVGSGKAAPTPVGGTVEEIPLLVKGLINHARANDTPMVVTYVDEVNVPHSSYRGSTAVIGPRQISLWVRDAEHGLAAAIVNNPFVTLVYGDMRSSFVAVSVNGEAHIATDAETRRRAYELPIESEQNHDLERKGVAVIVEVLDMSAFVSGVRFAIPRPS